MTHLQLSHARQTLLRWSWTGLRPMSGGSGGSSTFFFLDWWLEEPSVDMAVVSVMTVWGRDGDLVPDRELYRGV